MANPQKENGNTSIANELLDAMARYHLSGNEWMVVFVVIRKTYGWNKKADAISLTQFQRLTGMSRGSVCESLRKLVGKSILQVVEKKGLVNSYMINKNYEQWTSTEKGTSRVFGVQVVGKKGPVLVGKKGHTKPIPKTTIQKPPPTPYADATGSGVGGGPSPSAGGEEGADRFYDSQDNVLGLTEYEIRSLDRPEYADIWLHDEYVEICGRVRSGEIQVKSPLRFMEKRIESIYLTRKGA